MADKPTFRIIDGDKWNSNIDFEQLKLDYLNPKITVDDILKKHNISRGEYHRQRKRIVEETGIPVKPSVHGGQPKIHNSNEHITYDSLAQKFRVSKYINGMLRHYGRYKTLEEAQRVRDVMIDHDWDYDFYWNNIKPSYFTKFPLSSREEVMDDFEKDYLEGMTGKELMKKYGLSPHYLNTLSMSIKHKHGLMRKPTKVRA